MPTQSRTFAPSIRLRPFVGAYWARAARHDRRTMRILPDASSYIIFELGGERAGWAYAVGTQLRPILIELRGNVDRVGVRLHPGMASVLFGLPAKDLRDRVAGLDDVCIRAPSSLLVNLMNARSFAARVGALEDWLLGQLAQLEPSAHARQRSTARLFHAVCRGAGPRDLIEQTGWNERSIQRFFIERFGASAVTLKRLSRFRRSLAALEADSRASRAILATELGYSDQAHMCREFREFAGTDIGSLLAERRRVGNVQAAGHPTP